MQEAAFGGAGFLRTPYSYMFGDKANTAYAIVDIGTSVASLGRRVGMKSIETWESNVEYYRTMYQYETMSRGMIALETLNYGNTIYSNKD